MLIFHKHVMFRMCSRFYLLVFFYIAPSFFWASGEWTWMATKGWFGIL